MTPTTGWRSRPIRDAAQTHRDRQAQAAALQRQFVGDSQMTAQQLLAQQRGLKADFYARQARTA